MLPWAAGLARPLALPNDCKPDMLWLRLVFAHRTMYKKPYEPLPVSGDCVLIFDYSLRLFREISNDGEPKEFTLQGLDQDHHPEDHKG